MSDKTKIEKLLAKRTTCFSELEAYLWLCFQLDSCRDNGAFRTGRRQIAKVLGWTPDKVRSWMRGLEREELILLEKIRDTETIVRWGKNAPQSRYMSATPTLHSDYKDSNDIKEVTSTPDYATATPPLHADPILDTDTKKLDTKIIKTKKESAIALTSQQVVSLDLPPKFGPQATAALASWAAYRADLKKPLLQTSWVALLAKWGDRPREFVEAVEYSLANGYQGLFEPKTNGNGAHKPKLSATELYEQKAVALWEKLKLEEDYEEN